MISAQSGQDLLRHVAGSLRRYWQSATAVGLIALLTGGLVIATLAPKYVVTSTVAITPQRADPLSSVQSGVDVVSDDLPATVAAQLQARELVAQTLRDFPPPAPKPRLGLKGFLCRHVHLFCPSKAPSDPEAKFQGEVDAMMGALTVTPELHSRVIDITVKDSEAGHAASVANDLVDRYIADALDAQIKDLNDVGRWLDARTEHLRERWVAAVRKADDYDVSHQLVNGVAGGAAGSPLVAQQITQVATQLSNAQAREAAAGARAAALSAGGRADPRAVIALGQEPVLVAAANALMQLRAERDSDLARLGPQHPAVRAIDRQIAAAQSSLSSETAVAVASIRADQTSAAAEVAQLRANLGRLRGESSSQSAPEAVYRTLVEEAESAKVVYDTFLDRSKALADRAELVRPPVAFVSRAIAPLRPNFPNRRKLAVGLVVVAAVLAIATALIRAFFAHEFATIGALRAALPAEILAAIPGGRAASGSSDRTSPAARAAHLLAARLGISGQTASSPRVVLLLSAMPGEGVHDVAAMLADAAGAVPSGIVVVDADIAAGGRPALGFANLAAGSATIDEVATTAASVTRIGPGSGETDAAGITSAVSLLAARYGLVILAGPALLACSEALLLARACECTVFVTRWRFASRDSVAAAFDLVSAQTRRLAGIVVTGADARTTTILGSEYGPGERTLIRHRYGI